MAQLTIQLLGPARVFVSGEPARGFESNKVRALLAYLVVEATRPFRRETLAGLLWPARPERSARRNLRRALLNLRQVVADHTAEPPYFLIDRHTIQFNSAANCRVDTAVLINSRLNLMRPSELEEIVALYDGPFLDGFSLPECVAFGEWLLLKRELFQLKIMSALEQLAALYENDGQTSPALRCARQILAIEPWREPAHRQIMRLLAGQGQRSAALVQYERCRAILAVELDVAPEHETTRLYENLRRGQSRSWIPPWAKRPPSD